VFSVSWVYSVSLNGLRLEQRHDSEPGAAGASGTAGQRERHGGGHGRCHGTGGGATGTGGANPIVVTPEGTLFMDDFESGAAKWTFTQGTCSVMVDGADGGTDVTNSNVLNCINGGNEARALAGQVGWGEYSVQAKVKVNAMDAGRRIYLAGRFTDSSNWYGAAIYNGTPFEVQVRKKVGGTSAEHRPRAVSDRARQVVHAQAGAEGLDAAPVRRRRHPDRDHRYPVRFRPGRPAGRPQRS
jgi:hypothetical protein